jgi:hypothetical protein
MAPIDHRVPEPLHVGQQPGAAGVADDLTEDVAEQPDVAAHRLGEGGPVLSRVLSMALFTPRANSA